MILDEENVCHEICGDGVHQHDVVCDDGHPMGGLGCSSICTPEKDYYCRGGYFGMRDTCSWVTTEIKSVDVTKNNDIILEFSRPINFSKRLYIVLS